MSSVIAKVCKLSHKQFRAILKKFRRKKKRQYLAREREQKELLEQQRRESSPNFKAREEEKHRNEELLVQFEERERLRQHKLWLWQEQQAQIEFKKKQEQIEVEKVKREEERKRILAEFEKQQFIESKVEEENQTLKSRKEEALQEALSNLPEGDGPWHNPIAPQNYNLGTEREQCQFFAKTGCCRFGERCSRGHIHPAVSSTLLIRGMYTHFSIGQSGRNDFDTDDVLEFEDKERYQDFENFYWDVLPEFKKHGKVVQFKVCSNHEPHLRGNVYIQYSKEEGAVEAYKHFNGRYYAGKQLTCEFTHVIKWRSAICGLFFRKMCPKGINCNFLHVFKNPTDEFRDADRDFFDQDNHNSHSSRNKHSRYKNDRRSSHHDSNEGHRSHRENYDYRNSYRSHHRDRSSDSESNDEENIYSSSSRKKHLARNKNSSHHRFHKRKHRYSRSRSRSPYYSSDDTNSTNNHKKNKHKKKKSKKSKRTKDSDGSDHSSP